MSFINFAAREINCKIVYYGPGLCGKTTNLLVIFDKLDSDKRGKMLSLATKTDRTLFFDFLPLDLGKIRGMRTKLSLTLALSRDAARVHSIRPELVEAPSAAAPVRRLYSRCISQMPRANGRTITRPDERTRRWGGILHVPVTLCRSRAMTPRYQTA